MQAGLQEGTDAQLAQQAAAQAARPIARGTAAKPLRVMELFQPPPKPMAIPTARRQHTNALSNITDIDTPPQKLDNGIGRGKPTATVGENPIHNGAGDQIDGIKIIDGKVGGKIPIDEFKTIRQFSIKNPSADSITLGKYTNGLDSYIAKARDNSSYFDMESEWNTIKKKYNLEYYEMFEYFNKPALMDAIRSGKSIRFSHNPINDDGFLGMEWDYIKDTLYVTDDDIVERGGMWYVK